MGKKKQPPPPPKGPRGVFAAWRQDYVQALHSRMAAAGTLIPEDERADVETAAAVHACEHGYGDTRDWDSDPPTTPEEEAERKAARQATAARAEAAGWQRVFVCQRREEPYYWCPLGEGQPRHHEFAEALPSEAVIQATLEPWQSVTDVFGICFAVYSKERVFMYNPTARVKGRLLEPAGVFPPQPAWPLPPGAGRCGGDKCDVWSAKADLPVREALDLHALRTGDRPIPRYQMIIDPNQFVRETRRGPTWVPCEFDVQADGGVHLVGGDRAHVYASLVDTVATPVLKAAMPMLAQLRRPKILLDGRRLQVVVKAQRIIVPPKVTDGTDSEYIGLWHVDGHLEHVVAVVLYYYHVDPSLQGGDMEFCGREPLDVVGFGDCKQNYQDVNAESLRQALRGGATPTCRAPIETGTLLVFSNYQMVHRVLRMINTSTEKEASRDFVALFVIDPLAPLVPSRSHLARPYVLSRSLGTIATPLGPLKPTCVQRVLEFEGSAVGRSAALRRRNDMLREQLKPSGCFSAFGPVSNTGNGCFTMIGWLDQMLLEPTPQFNGEDDLGPQFEHNKWLREDHESGHARIQGLNLSPKKLGRGSSEILSLTSTELRQRLRGGGPPSEDGSDGSGP